MMDQKPAASGEELPSTWAGRQQQIRQELARLRSVRAAGRVPDIVPALQRMAGILRSQDRPYQALRYLEEARELLAEHPDDPRLAEVLAELGSIQYDDLVDIEAALGTFRSSLAIATRERQSGTLALALTGDAAVRIILGDFDLALKRTTSALAHAEAAGRGGLLGPIHNLLAVIHFTTDRQKGLEHCRTAHDLRDSDDYVSRAADLNNIAMMLSGTGDDEAAERYHHEAVATFDLATERDRQHYDYLRRQLGFSLAEFRINHRQPEEALALLRGEMSMRDFSRPKMRRPLAYGYLTKGQAHVMMQDAAKATAAVQKAMRCAVSVRDAHLIASAYRLMAAITEIGKGRPIGWMRSIEAASAFDGIARGRAGSEAGGDEDGTDIESMRQLRRLKSELDRRSRAVPATEAGLTEYREAMVQLRHRIDPFLLRHDECGRLSRELLGVIERVEHQAEPSTATERRIRVSDDRFVQSLSAQFPGLTATELKICTMLRASMSSKDIAALLSLSAYTVDTHRKRIRKKCGLSRTDNIQAFLLSVG